MCGGHSCLKSSLMHDGRTHKYTRGHNHVYKWAKYVCEGSLGSLKEKWVHLFLSPFLQHATKQWQSAHLALVWVVFLCICIPSQARLILIFMSWAWRAYYYYHYCYYAFRGRKITLGLAEAVQNQQPITAPIIRLVWFMIYADHIRPEITPLEALGCKKLF